MEKIFTVCILDTNRFFSLGIQQILVPYFQQQGQEVRFVSEEEVTGANLVFWSVRTGWPLPLCRLRLPERPMTPVFIAIRTKQSKKNNRCLHEHGSLLRHDLSKTLLLMVDQVLKMWKSPLQQTLCPCCVSFTLTGREQEVMRHMSREQAQKSLSNVLDISHKTISSHKRAVMRKLGFRRNTELYHWLRLGGLDHITKSDNL